MAKKNYYVVLTGRKPGIYETWAECETQVKGFSGAKYKGFADYNDAYTLFHGERLPKNAPELEEKPVAQVLATERSISTDAACSGNPGRMEFRIVWSDTGEVIYHSPVFKKATNNIGEFLALVSAIKWVRENGCDIDILTDSQTALSWVRKKKHKSSFDYTQDNELNRLMTAAFDYLENNEPYERLRKWNTKLQGEIKADFGRK